MLIRLPQDFVLPKDWEPGEVQVIDPEPGSPDVVKEERFADGSVLFATSLGRILFNDTLPVDYPFINEQRRRASSRRSSTTSRPVTPPSRWLLPSTH